MHAGAQLEIRRVGPEDAPAIARVLQDAFFEFKPLYTDGGFAATTPEVGEILGRMREGPVWIALRGVVVVGTVSAVTRGGSVYIRGMAVLPAVRGSGAGARLLEQLEDWKKGEGYSRLFLSTTPFLKFCNPSVRKIRLPADRRQCSRSLRYSSVHDGKNYFQIVERASRASAAGAGLLAIVPFLNKSISKYVSDRTRRARRRLTFLIRSRPTQR